MNSSYIVLISSLDKGFGAPLAILAGSRAMVKRFEKMSETRVHTSPPSSIAIHAAEHVMTVNKAHGDTLRSRFAQLVRQFKQYLAIFGLTTTGGLFPVQTLRAMPELDARFVHNRLLKLGVHAMLQRPRCKREAAISILIIALHRFTVIEWAAFTLAEVLQNTGINTGKIMEKDYEPFGYGFGTV